MKKIYPGFLLVYFTFLLCGLLYLSPIQAQVTATTETVSHILCHGGNTGAVSVTASGGTPNYSYLWSTNPAETTDLVDDLVAGTYYVTVTDAMGAKAYATAVVTQPLPLNISASVTNHVSVYQGTDGVAGSVTSGGVNPYGYAWSTAPVQTNPSATNLAAGNYWVTVTDANGCKASSSVTITQPAIHLLTPNGGEIWQRGTTHTITWNTSLTGFFTIELYKGGVFNQLLTNWAAGTSYTWYISSTIAAGNDYQIKVSGNPGLTESDLSDANFTICLGTPGGAITVTSPNGGEAWQRGTNHSITWTDNLTENVKIELYKGGVLNTVLSNSASGNSYNWYISNSTITGTDYKIKISSVLDPGTSDQSNVNFAITAGTPNGTVTVVTPNGGEAWQINTHQFITWTSNLTENVLIELYKGGSLYQVLTNYGTGSSYDWYIDPSLPAGTDYRIQITSVLDPSITDQSNADFSLTTGTPNGTMTVVSPNGGEIWQINSHQTVTWTTNVSELVVVELFKGGVYYSTLTNHGIGGTFNWYIDPTLVVPGIDYRIKVYSSLNGVIADYSNADFALTLGTPNGWVTVGSPNGGESWQIGSHQTISWTDNLAENVKIELYKNGLLYSLLSANATGTTFDWYIDPNLVIAGADYKVKITSVIDPGITDQSNGNFSLTSGTPSGTITLTAPNGGEIWQSGTIHTVTWTTLISENVVIELFKGGVSYAVLSYWGTGGSYNWYIDHTIPAGTDYRIKVSSILNAAITDMSDADFSISSGSPGGSVTVTSPNGGEGWQKGTTQTITWTDNLTENVKIELIKGGVTTTVLSNSASGNSYSWYIVNSITAGNDYKIKVSSILDGGISDLSNANFAIFDGTPNGNVTVTSPNGGESWQLGTHHTVTWTSNLSEHVKIELMKGGSLYMVLSNWGTGGSFNWYIDPGLPAGSDYRIKVSSILDPTTADLSDADFTLTQGTPNGTITVVSPNGGEAWQIATHQTITWTTNLSEYVVISLYKGGILYQVLSNYGTGGSFDWYIDPTVVVSGTDYRIRIASSLNGSLFDISNANFSLVNGTPNGTITVTSPNGGESWAIGSTHAVTWTTAITENVKVDLYKGGVFQYTITNWGSGGSHNWYISPGTTPGADYRVKVTSVLNPAITDESNANFGIVSTDVVVYPNPCDQYTVLNFENMPPDNYGIRLFNRFGVQVFSGLVNTEETLTYQLVTSGLPTGIYVLKVGNGEITVTKRVIVQH